MHDARRRARDVLGNQVSLEHPLDVGSQRRRGSLALHQQLAQPPPDEQGWKCLGEHAVEALPLLRISDTDQDGAVTEPLDGRGHEVAEHATRTPSASSPARTA
jgi:hypothetical protein